MIKALTEVTQDLIHPIPVHGIAEEGRMITICITVDDLKSGD